MQQRPVCGAWAFGGAVAKATATGARALGGASGGVSCAPRGGPGCHAKSPAQVTRVNGGVSGGVAGAP